VEEPPVAEEAVEDFNIKSAVLNKERRAQYV